MNLSNHTNSLTTSTELLVTKHLLLPLLGIYRISKTVLVVPQNQYVLLSVKARFQQGALLDGSHSHLLIGDNMIEKILVCYFAQGIIITIKPTTKALLPGGLGKPSQLWRASSYC
jgi:hypothetical protein